MLKYAVFEFKMSSWVKSDPAILTGSKKRSWSQKMGSLAQKTKKLQANELKSLFAHHTGILSSFVVQIIYLHYLTAPRGARVVKRTGRT